MLAAVGGKQDEPAPAPEDARVAAAGGAAWMMAGAYAAAAKQLVELCAQGGWSDAVRACLVRAAHIDDMGNCFAKP